MLDNYNDVFTTNSWSASEKNGISIHFHDLENVVIEQIRSCDAVVGCVAWLTSFRIIDALAKLPHGACFVMDKSKALEMSSNVRKRIATIPPLTIEISHLDLGCIFKHPVLPKVKNEDALRVFGRIPNDESESKRKRRSLPLLHHKFMVFCNLSDDEELIPKSFITGSYNFTYNGNNCRENIIIVDDEDLASRYFDEWSICFLLSEQLEGCSSEITPQYLDSKSAAELQELYRLDDEAIEEFAYQNGLSQGKGWDDP